MPHSDFEISRFGTYKNTKQRTEFRRMAESGGERD